MSQAERLECISLVDEAVAAGARIEQACECLSFSPETLQRWKENPNVEDQRSGPKTPLASRLSDSERATIAEIVSSPRFRDKSPWQIVPLLADEGRYIASEATFYRVMRALGLLAHRGRSRPAERKRPTPLIAKGPNQIYSWDITYLLSLIAGQFFYLYLVMDIFSRKIVAWQIEESENGELASMLIAGLCEREGIQKGQLVVHSDNGAPMKGATLLSTFDRLGVTPSRSRPRVSNDNPYSEAMFKTLKYQPTYPDGPFTSIEQARLWVESFVTWYNTEHLHSEIRYVTPESKHQGKDVEILRKRKEVYAAAKNQNPARWSGDTRNWNAITEVHLNPGKTKREEKVKIVEQPTDSKKPIFKGIQSIAA